VTAAGALGSHGQDASFFQHLHCLAEGGHVGLAALQRNAFPQAEQQRSKERMFQVLCLYEPGHWARGQVRVENWRFQKVDVVSGDYERASLWHLRQLGIVNPAEDV